MGTLPHSHLTGISAFVQTVEAGSFTAAAARMGLTKSAVGKNVTRLEERLGIRLLNRTTRSISLTAEGEAYYSSCLRILEELGNAEALLASQRQEVSGRLRLNVPLSFGRLWVMPTLHQVASAHPRLSLEVTFSDGETNIIDEGFDLVVRIGPAGDQASIQGRRVGTQSWTFCASPAYLDAHGHPRKPDDLSSHDCIVFARDGRIRPWIVTTPRGKAVMKIAPRHIICHGEALRDAAVCGMGIACLPTWLIHDDLRAGRLHQVLDDGPVEGEHIHLLWPHSRPLVPKTRVVVDALKETFLPTAPWDQPT